MSEVSAPGSTPDPPHPGQAEPRGSSFLPVVTAVLVDAAFFLKRAHAIFGELTPDGAAARLQGMAHQHLVDGDGSSAVARLYRIYVYDAPPAVWRGHLPISRKGLDLGKSPTAKWRSAFHDELRGLRKVALRFGEIPTNDVQWKLPPAVFKELLNGRRAWASLTDADFALDLRQKGVDMRLGLDIASLAYKRQVNQIVLVAGDADFVPAAKLARREGIDVILDPMWATIRPQLFEHIDGLRNVAPKPGAPTKGESP